MKVAVITPYFNEPDTILARCMDSVWAQTVRCDHYMIADGPGYQWVEDSNVARHIALGEPHKDYGNTPRAIGALLAASEGADAICFLDADNLYDPNHIEACIEVASKTPDLDYVVARRRIVLQDGAFVTAKEERDHVDTNCFFLLRGAFHAIPQQALQPKELSIVGDRFFSRRLNALRSARTDTPTVTYISNWLPHYKMAGKEPPPDAKEVVTTDHITPWWRSLSSAEQSVIFRNIGFEFKFT